MPKESPRQQEQHNTKMFVLKFNDMRVTGKVPSKGLSVIGKHLNQKSAETLTAPRGAAALRPLAAQQTQHSRYASGMFTSEMSVTNFPVHFSSNKPSVSQGTLRLTLSKGVSLTQSCNNFLQKTE